MLILIFCIPILLIAQQPDITWSGYYPTEYVSGTSYTVNVVKETPAGGTYLIRLEYGGMISIKKVIITK